MRLIRIIAGGILAFGAIALLVGALLLKASHNTGAETDYNVNVSWASVFGSVLWPPYRIPFHYLFAALFPVTLAWLSFFHLPRFIGSPLLLLQAGISFFWEQAGAYGCFFLIRELETYRFRIDGERLGEQWFTFEAVAIWMMVTGFLGLLRLTFRGAKAPSRRQSPTTGHPDDSPQAAQID